MANWVQPYAPVFDPQGDTTAQMLDKLNKNQQDVYSKLNRVRTLDASDVEPSDKIQNHFWFDTGSNTLKRWNGSAWVEVVGKSVSTEADFIDAINNAGLNDTEIVITGNITYNQDITVPDNINLVFTKGGLLTAGEKTQTTETAGTGDGVTVDFSYTVYDPPIKRGSITVSYTIGGNSYTATDDGKGDITGTNLNGTVDYLTGNVSLTFTSAPDNLTSIDITYTPIYSLTINGNITAGLWKIFDGEVLGDPVVDFVYPQWFGAKADGNNDDTIAILKALQLKNSVKFEGVFYVTKTINIYTSYTKLIGGNGSQIHSTALPCIKVFQKNDTINEFSVISNIILKNVGSRDYSNALNGAGILIDGQNSTNNNNLVQRLRIENVRVLGYTTGVYSYRNTNTILKNVYIEHYIDESSQPDTGYCYGVYLNCNNTNSGAISPQASILLDRVVVNLGGFPSGVEQTAFAFDGADVRDVFMRDCESANGDYGIYINGNASYNLNWDVHIINFICDAVNRDGVFINNINNGCINILGGYTVKNGDVSGAGIWTANSEGIVVNQHMVIGVVNSTNNNGIYLQNSHKCVIANCNLLNTGYGISLDGSTQNIIANNIVNGVDASLTFYDAIRCFNTSTGNRIQTNAIFGYYNGCVATADSYDNVWLFNTIGSVTNAYNDAANNTRLDLSTYLLNLPTTTPATGGLLWNDAGVVKVS